ncbi:MAG: hypothetical protein K2O85_08975 [Helicobacter sp.]|nr:hypothetical protein [Helicobacter sp.]
MANETLSDKVDKILAEYDNVQTENAWEWFFERVVLHIALGEGLDDTEL